MTIECIGVIHDCRASEIHSAANRVPDRGYRPSRDMHSSPLRALAAWLNALRNLASEQPAPGSCRENSKLGWDAAFAWDDAADDERFLYAALISATHY
jgi:hypothetical protein